VTAAITQIEFVTGPATAPYGSGDMAGIVNIITKAGEDVAGCNSRGVAAATIPGRSISTIWYKKAVNLRKSGTYISINDLSHSGSLASNLPPKTALYNSGKYW